MSQRQDHTGGEFRPHLPSRGGSDSALREGQAFAGADPHGAGGVAVNGPNRFVGQPFLAAPTFPLRVSEPARQSEAGDSDPQGTLAVGEYGGDVVADQTGATIDQAPVGLLPSAKAVGTRHDHIAIPGHLENGVAEKWSERFGFRGGEGGEALELAGLGAADPNGAFAEHPQVAGGAGSKA